MVVRVKLKLSAIIEHLLLDFTVQNTDTALLPSLGSLEFWEESTNEEHTLRLEEQVIAHLGIVTQDVLCMTVIVDQKFGEELWSEVWRIDKQGKLADLVLQTMRDFKRSPCKTCILYVVRKLLIVFHLILIGSNLYQWILLNPVEIFSLPLDGIFLVLGNLVNLAHRSEPFMTVQLPAQLIIFYWPVLPVDVLTIIIGRLVTIVNIESMLQCIVSPFSLTGRNRDFLQIYIRIMDTRACSIIMKEQFSCLLFITLLVLSLDRLQTRVVEIDDRENVRVDLFSFLFGCHHLC